MKTLIKLVAVFGVLLMSSGCSLIRDLPWQGMQSVLLAVICQSSPELSASHPACEERGALMAHIIESPSKPFKDPVYRPVSVPVPAHLLERFLLASPGDHLELHFSAPGVASLASVQDKGRPPARWARPVNQAVADLEAERADLEEAREVRELQRRVATLTKGLDASEGPALRTVPKRPSQKPQRWQWSTP